MYVNSGDLERKSRERSFVCIQNFKFFRELDKERKNYINPFWALTGLGEWEKSPK